MSPCPSCSSVGVKSSATDQDRTGSKCVRARVVTSSRIVKNDAAVNFPHNKGLGAVPAIAAAAVFSISTKQPSMVERTAGCDRTFKSRYRFGASNSRWIFNAAWTSTIGCWANGRYSGPSMQSHEPCTRCTTPAAIRGAHRESDPPRGQRYNNARNRCRRTDRSTPTPTTMAIARLVPPLRDLLRQ
jgi:hypothetical protein